MKKVLHFVLAFVVVGLVKTIGRLMYSFQVTGKDNVPMEGGALIVANHLSYVDFVLLVTSIPRPVHFVMNEDVFKKPFLRPLLNALHCIPIAPRAGKNNFEDFNRAVSENIANGKIVAIFAEGTVSRTGQLLEFKKGVEHLSKIIQAPIIPVHFHNVIGSPLTFRAGHRRMIKFNLKSLRRKIMVMIGQPIIGPITAFSLRQQMKEMEAAHVNRMIRREDRMDILINKVLRSKPQGCWKARDQKIYFSSLTNRLKGMHNTLAQPLSAHRKVALLLPKNTESLLLHVYLMQQGITIVHLRADMTNEECFALSKQTNTRLIITTRDLKFSSSAPVNDEIIYIEDIFDSIAKGVVAPSICVRARKEVRSWFTSARTNEDVVVIFSEKNEEGQFNLFPTTHRQLIAAVNALRQVYYFEKGTSIMADLELFDAFGFVIEFLLPLISDMSLEIFPDQTGSDEFADRLQQSDASLVICTPTQLKAVARLAQKKNFANLKTLFTAAIHPSEDSIQQLMERGIQVMTCAGSPLTASVFAVNVHNYQGRDIVGKLLEQEGFEAGSVGKPLPGYAVRVFTEGGKECEVDESGTIWVFGPGVMNEDGLKWRPTSFKGRLNHRGFLFIH